MKKTIAALRLILLLPFCILVIFGTQYLLFKIMGIFFKEDDIIYKIFVSPTISGISGIYYVYFGALFAGSPIKKGFDFRARMLYHIGLFIGILCLLYSIYIKNYWGLLIYPCFISGCYKGVLFFHSYKIKKMLT